MLHLAKVLQRNSSGDATLQLLAFQKPDQTWAVLQRTEISVSSFGVAFQSGSLVLLEILESGRTDQVRDATDWVLELVSKYLSPGFTPRFLQKEIEMAEEWRQQLTLESQDLARRSLELEARREQIQILEESLQRERQELEHLANQLKTEQNH